MGKEKRPLQSERINRYLFCFWFQVIRQDDLSNRDFPQFLLHPMGEADRLCRTAGFPSVIDSDHSVGVLHHIAVSVGVDAWEIFFLYDNNIRTSLQQFTGSCFLIQAVQTLSLIHIYSDAQEVRCSACHPAYCSCGSGLPHKVPHCEDNFPAPETAVRQTEFLFG